MSTRRKFLHLLGLGTPALILSSSETPRTPVKSNSCPKREDGQNHEPLHTYNMPETFDPKVIQLVPNENSKFNLMHFNFSTSGTVSGPNGGVNVCKHCHTLYFEATGVDV